MIAKNFLISFLLFFLAIDAHLSAQWQQINSIKGGSFTSFAYDGSRFYCGSFGGGIYSTDDLGVNWTARGLDYPFQPVKCLLIEDEYIYASVESRGVYISSDKGEHWNLVNNGLPQLLGIFNMAAMDSFVFAVAPYEIYATTDNGQNWVLRNSGFSGQFINCLFVKDSLLLAGTDDGIYSSTNYGNEWILRSNGIENAFINQITDIGDNIFATADGDVYISTNNGLNWTLTNGNGLPGSIINSLISINSALFAAPAGRGIYNSTDMGNTWSRIGKYCPDIQRTNVLGRAGNNLFAGSTTNIYELTEGDTTLYEKDDGIYALDIDCMDSGSNNLYLGTGGGKIYQSTDSGLNWQIKRIPDTYDDIIDVAVREDTIYAVTYQHFYFSTDNGITWIASPINILILCMAVDNNKIYLGTFQSGGVWISTDIGLTWTQKNNGFWNDVISDIAVSGNNILAGTEQGLYISSDEGENWSHIPEISGNAYIQKVEIIGDYVYSGGTSGIFVSADNGLSWQNRGLANGKFSAICGFGDIVFASKYYAMYYSTDAGSQWQEIGEGLPGRALTSMKILDTTLFVGIQGHGLWERSAVITAVKPQEEINPERHRLFQNYPNPFNPMTTIKYEIRDGGVVQLKVYDILGKEVETLVNAYQSAGNHSVQFKDTGLSSGIYFYQLKIGEYSRTKKLLLIK